MNPPGYFHSIKTRASENWDLLEKQPDIAGPWHQLFKQIAQSPRHVVSELLQNADDAGATEASVEIANSEFVFSHNGEDFTEEQFYSLCRFGFSNKRALHTIGFRGIGFKSTFSIGDEVRLYTPSLAIAFRKRRFTEPIWITDLTSNQNKTEIRISIKDERIREDLEKNFKEWIGNPTSLLFFRTIRRLKINNKEIHWQSHGDGPVTNSQWMSLSSAPDNKYLYIFSGEEEFPLDSLQEIKEERMVLDKETTFPPCRVDIVLGREGRLFVVLFTGVKTTLPFACNAPFVPDPARLKIKDPVSSPTNRWLLARIGKLAAEAMLGWLNREDMAVTERCAAYELWPDVDRDENTLEGTCATAVELAFESYIEGNKCLISEKETIVLKGECVAVPQVLLDIWEPEQISVLFDQQQRSILSRSIGSKCCQKLINWQYVDVIDKSQVVQVLESKHVPNPGTWRQLMILWAYISDQVVSYYYNDHRGVRIVPVQSKDILYSTQELVRLGEKQLLESQEDWEFLSAYLLVLNQNWPRFLAEQRLNSVNRQDKVLAEQVESAYKVLNALNLVQASDVGSVMEQVSTKFFTQQSCNRSDCVRLAHIAAKLGAQISETFQFVTQDNYRRPAKGILANITSDLDMFVVEKWYQEHVLHEDYSKSSGSCSTEDWAAWIKSDRSRLLTFVPLDNTKSNIYSKYSLNNRLSERTFNGRLDYRYKTEHFSFLDWDFEQSFWEHWKGLAKEDKKFWSQLLNHIIEQPSTYWSKALSARALHVATTGSTSAVTSDVIVPKWIMKFRELACLEDTHGEPRQPAELLRRTPETEALLGVESFVAAEIDTETNRPLLQMLGVRDTPTGPDKLLERLRALSKASSPPLHEV
ncbi:ATPase, partial [Dehalococcoides sp. THU3]